MKKITIEHGWYGCETGCCGTIVEVTEDGKTHNQFVWGHLYEKDNKDEFIKYVLKEAYIELSPNDIVVLGNMSCFN